MNNKLLITAASLAAPVLLAASVAGPLGYGEFKGRDEVPVKEAQGIATTQAPVGMQRAIGMAGGGEEQITKYGELTKILEEDFSLITTGTETEPDRTVALDIPQLITDPATGNTIENPKWQYVWNNMDTQYTHGEGRWGIGNAYPAGEKICFTIDGKNPEAHIVTPIMDLTANNGTFVLEFRAKAVGEGETLPMAMRVEASETFNWGPTWDEFDPAVTFIDMPKEWTTYRVIFQNAGPTSICNIYVALTEDPRFYEGNCGLLVDDVKMYSLKPYLNTPVLAKHTDFTPTSFKANWEPVEGAESYLVSVWYVDDNGDRQYVKKDESVTGTSLEVTGVAETRAYFYDVRAVGGGHESLTQIPREVFDIVAPELLPAAPGKDGISFLGRVNPVASAYGYNYQASNERVAEADGEFVITHEEFTGWKHPSIETDQPVWTIENPYDRVASLYYPIDIKQQGWHGENFNTYKDFICIDPYFWEMSREQCGWISPDFDLSKDGGKISIDMKLASKDCTMYDEEGNVHYLNAECVVALFNWDETIGDYVQVESVKCTGTNGTWQDYHVDLTKGAKRSKIGFFAVGSLDNLYIDDIIIKQNYKAGEKFYDPFFYRTWQLAEEAKKNGEDYTQFQFTVPDYASGTDVYNTAQAVRMHLDSRGSYDSEVISDYSPNEYVGHTDKYSGVQLVMEEGNGNAVLTDGVIYIQNPDGEQVFVYAVDGKAVTLGNGAEIRYAVDRGVYVVRIGSKSIKLAY